MVRWTDLCWETAAVLLRKAELRDRFMHHLGRATFVDIATAFVDDLTYARREKRELVDALIASCRRGARVRVLVGAMGTDFQKRRGWMRWLASQDVEVREHSHSFHAKAYIFGHEDNTFGWVGSANLTGSGFGGNEELIVETTEHRDVRDLVSWYASQWAGSATRKVVSSIQYSLDELVSDELVRGTPVVLTTGDRSSCVRAEVFVSAPAVASILWTEHKLRGDHGVHWISTPCDAVTGKQACGTVCLEIDPRHHNSHVTRELLEVGRTAGTEIYLRIANPTASCTAAFARTTRRR